MNPPHRISTHISRQALERVVPDGWYVDSQMPITLSRSEPEPDVSVVRGDTRNYADRRPGPAEVGLVMEIADTSLERDSIRKKRIYAAAGIPYDWLLNLKTRSLEVYSVPQGNEYTRRGFTDLSRRWTWSWMGKLWERCVLAICSLTKPAALFH